MGKQNRVIYYFAFIFFFGISCTDHAKGEAPDLPSSKLLPGLEKIRAQLNKDFDPSITLPLNTERDKNYSGPADSLVEYTIAVPRPNKYYSVEITVAYFPSVNEAKTGFKNDYADFKKRNSGEGTLTPEVYYRIGNCTIAIHYGCCLSKTNTEALLNSFFEELYKENEKKNSWFKSYCGGGTNHSADME